MMKFVDAVRMEKGTRLAIVGGGGKTTAMFQLAHQFETPVIVTTTTHLGTEQGALADVHFALRDGAVLPDMERVIRDHQVVLVTGEPHSDERLGSTPPEILLQLKVFADEKTIPLLIEADGSRKLPIKAPAEKEPVIPDWVNTVMVVVGLSSVGMIASEQTIHRFSHFSAITGLPQGEQIGVHAIEKMLVHSSGGLKRIPKGAKRIALLNQADDDDLVMAASALAERLIGVYDTALVASLKESDAGVKYCAERIAGVVLAAGGASRYGEPKALLEWHREPLVRHVAIKALEAGLKPVVVVIGAVIEPIRDALVDLPVVFVENPGWEKGQSTSLRVAMNALEGFACGGAVMLQADQPRVPVALLRQLIELHAKDISTIVIPRVEGHPSSPVLFDRQYFKILTTIEGDKGGRALFEKYRKQWLEWRTAEDLMDIDTPKDYARLLKMD